MPRIDAPLPATRSAAPYADLALVLSMLGSPQCLLLLHYLLEDEPRSTQIRLVAVTGLTARTIQDWMIKLEARGLVSKDGLDGRTNAYRIRPEMTPFFRSLFSFVERKEE